MSPRCLYFSDQAVYFRCGIPYVLSQSGVNGGVTGPVRPVKERWGAVDKEPMDTTLLGNLHVNKSKMAEDKRTKKLFGAYKECVDMYTKRQLRHDGDILDAFAGTLSVLSTAFQSDHWCGLPASALDLALLWTPADKTYRRGLEYAPLPNNHLMSTRPPGSILPTNRGTVQVVFGPSEVTALDDKVDRRFPSWSWAGWKGPVGYHPFDDVHPDKPPPGSLVNKFAINLGGGGLRFTPGRGIDENEPIARVSSSDPVGNEDQQYLPSPSIPNVLQFLAPCLPLTTFTISPQVDYIPAHGVPHSPTRQGVRSILDRHRKRCGVWWEQAGYVYVGRGLSPEAEAKMVLVGVSCQADATQLIYEDSIALFDTEAYGESGHGDGLVNVMVVDLDMGHEFGERVTVARIHQRAWQEAGPLMKMVRLA